MEERIAALEDLMAELFERLEAIEYRVHNTLDNNMGNMGENLNEANASIDDIIIAITPTGVEQ